MQTEQRYIMAFFAIALFCLFNNIALCAEQFMLSIPAKKIISQIEKRDRVSGYTIDMSVGRVYSIMKIPDDWWIEGKDVEPPQLKAWAFHGTGFLTVEEIEKGIFSQFLVIETWPDEGQFDIKINLIIDLFMKEKEQCLIFDKNDLIISPIDETK